MLTIDPQTEYDLIGHTYAAAEALLAEPMDTLSVVVEAASGWSPAQHLYHLAMANGGMLKAVAVLAQRATTPETSEGLNALGLRVLQREVFPRGGQAPLSVVPPETPTAEALQTAWTRSRSRFESVAEWLPQVPQATGRIAHPYFGNLSALEWLRTTRLHARHHLDIIDAIRTHA